MKDLQNKTIVAIDQIALPGELLYIIKTYVFPNKIPKTDTRYSILSTIPPKEFDESDGVTFVYMRINDTKDFYMTYKDSEIQLQTLLYDIDSNEIQGIEGHIISL